MAEQTWLKYGALLIVGLLVGWGLTATLTEPEQVEVEVIKEVPVEVAVVTEVEVEKIVEVETIVEVPAVLEFSSFLDDALDYVLDEIQDDYNTCGGDEYDDDEISIRNVKDDWKIEVDDEDEYVITGEVRAKYKDEDKCYRWFEFEVEYDDDDVDVEVDA